MVMADLIPLSIFVYNKAGPCTSLVTDLLCMASMASERHCLPTNQSIMARVRVLGTYTYAHGPILLTSSAIYT